jgi:hypothetical protein
MMGTMLMLVMPNDQLTDRHRKRALAANPTSEMPGASESEARVAVRWSAWFGVF